MTENTLRSVTVERTGTGHFTATNPRGGTISFGTSSDPHGGTDFTPVELLLAAIGGCTAADVDVATARHAEPTGFTVSVTGDKISDEFGNRMTDLMVTFSVTFPDGELGDRARAILPGQSRPPTPGSARSAVRSRSARPSRRRSRTPDPTGTKGHHVPQGWLRPGRVTWSSASAAFLIASRIREYVPQRQTFSIRSMSSSVGRDVFLSRAAAAMICPG